ncbi:hypothetical protein GGTG_03126 [Gaeumannomyces tritici R3-111a-1]|uniref:COP9 signalosome complex subunit 6 n=1 Tax=Gaeumannomyces tritici (strain R3-111a-1) TaxID=644352 RepID=J3NPB8_GAET3|nr:hypothetical protein GGTG_03126 [Gaeumannomyces tritici R3-111a-1]EJT78023.1 hypothetical protein GGTG_03126 [Gaeumannomyces tritici R3-111a-1]
MASSNQRNPFMSTHKSDSDLHIILHPLVLLTISDYITRHTLRGQTQPIVGAIIGRQDGRAITMEHAFECAAEPNITGGGRLVEPWFTERLDQMRLVHKDRGLDLVGWYTLLPRSGPNSEVLLLHNQILANNESAAILAVHPDEIVAGGATGGRLPISLYETVYESEEQRRDGGEDKVMKDGDDADDDSATPDPVALAASYTNIRFRELPYSVETGEAEMISMDFVARGGANATTSTTTDPQQQGPGDEQKKKQVPSQVKVDVKGKRRAVAKDEEDDDEASTAAGAIEPAVLSRDEEELVATLATKANAIRMLHARIQLIIKYLEGLPPSYLTTSDQAPSDSGAATEAEAIPTSTASTEGAAGATAEGLPVSSASPAPPPSPTLLRSIQALVNRIPLLIPSTTEAFEREMLSEANDVHIVSLLNDVMQSVNDLRDLGKKFHVVEQSKNRRQLNDHQGALSGMLGGMMGVADQQRLNFSVGDLLM